jgi:hypothetical protein
VAGKVEEVQGDPATELWDLLYEEALLKEFTPPA